jgi:hypothetical protein
LTEDQRKEGRGSPLAIACPKTLEFEAFVEHFVGHAIEIWAILDKVRDEVRDKESRPESCLVRG